MNRQLPIIIYTAYANFREDFTTWAARAYVIKSSDPTPLMSALAEAIDGSRATMTTASG